MATDQGGITIDDAQAFYDVIVRNFYAMMHKFETDNYDALRYSMDGVDRSQTFDLTRHVDFFKEFTRNHALFYETFALLEDTASKELYLHLILFRLLGHLHVKLPTNTPEMQAKRAMLDTLASTPSDIGLAAEFRPLRRFEIEHEGTPYVIHGWPGSILYTFLLNQYHFKRGGVRVVPEPDDHVVDGGACLGDTSVRFAKASGAGGHVYAVDCLPQHIAVTRRNAADNGVAERITPIQAALSDRDAEATTTLDKADLAPGFHIRPDDEGAFRHRSVDGMVADGTIERVDFLKMDIEGFEGPALRGAVDSLRRFRPKLAICLYHRLDDYHAIPRFLRDLDLGYRFFLDHYTIHGEETVLYGLPS